MNVIEPSSLTRMLYIVRHVIFRYDTFFSRRIKMSKKEEEPGRKIVFTYSIAKERKFSNYSLDFQLTVERQTSHL